MVFAKKYPTHNYKNRLLLFVPVAFFFFSCSNKKEVGLDYTPEFKKINENTNRISVKNPGKALQYLDSAFATLKNPNINDRFRLLGNHFAMNMRTTRDFKSALSTADSMLNLINSNGGVKTYPANFAEANFAKGDAFFELNNYNDAYGYYYIGYQTGKNHLNNYVISSYTYRMGMITYRQTHYKLSVGYFKESFDQSLPYTNDFAVFYRNQEVLDNIALAYCELGDTDSALVFFNKTITYIEQNAHLFPDKANLFEVAKAVVNGNIADIYTRRGDYETAEALLKKSIDVNLNPAGDHSDAMLAEMKLAKLYKELSREKDLRILLDTIHDQLERISDNKKNLDNRRVEADWYLLKSNLFESEGEPDLALRYDKRYIILKDSIAETIRKLKEMSISDKFDSYDKETQIETLTKYNKLQKIYLVVSLLAGLLAIAIIIMIYRNSLRSKKEVSTVNKLNSEVIQQKADLEHTLEKLNESSREKDRILHTVAHDLRNPLSGIASLTNIMSEDGYTEEQQEFILLIKDAADNSLQLINEIFEATDAGIGDIKLQPVEVNMLLKNSIELLRFKAAEKNQQIIFEPLDNPETIMANREKLWRVTSNLIVNAIKFSPVSTDITVDVKKTDTSVNICIKDRGIGIPEDLKPKIFNMFTEAKRLGTMGEKSFGLGLSICKQIVEKHGGKLWVEDNPGGGSVFCMSLNRDV